MGKETNFISLWEFYNKTNRKHPIKTSDIIDDKMILLITTHEKVLGLLRRYVEQTDKGNENLENK